MNPDNLGALLCRGVGLLLLLLGASYLLPVLLFGPRSGWTSYAPMGRVEQPDFWSLFLLGVRWNLPAVAQLVGGVLLLIFGRFFGRLLASGLFDHAA